MPQMRRSVLVKVPPFFQERGAGQEHVHELGRSVEEQVLHHHAFHGFQRRLAHVGDAQARPVVEIDAPGGLTFYSSVQGVRDEARTTRASASAAHAG